MGYLTLRAMVQWSCLNAPYKEIYLFIALLPLAFTEPQFKYNTINSFAPSIFSELVAMLCSITLNYLKLVSEQRYAVSNQIAKR